jgi:hypothetical protein
MERMSSLMDSSHEIIEDYRDMMIEQLHHQLEGETDYGNMRGIQGQIAGIRDFCMVIKF